MNSREHDLAASHEYGKWRHEDDLGDSRSHFSPGQDYRRQRGIPLRELVTEAVKDKLAADDKASEKPWVKPMGKLKDSRKETERINRLN